MPRKRRRARLRVRPDYVPDRDDIFFQCGHDFFRDVPSARNDELARDVWLEFGAGMPGVSSTWWGWKKFGKPGGGK